ncbi:histidine phosphatase superfamily [Xylaria sp. FL1777]|nr:histidine phosphatase superfamily [Xylaria sp. FL1777]
MERTTSSKQQRNHGCGIHNSLSMAPVIDVIRHAESTHNISGNAYERDPDLTAHGEWQAYFLGKTYPFMNKISHVVSSPMRRAIRTALIAFERVLLEGKKAILLPELQETGIQPSDMGQPPDALEVVFRPQIDTSLLDRKWFLKSQDSKYIPDVALVEARAREARVFLRELAQSGPDDAHIVVVSHGGFLHFLTESYSCLTEGHFTTYNNTTVQSFQFVDLYGTDPDAKMIETKENCKRLNLGPFMKMSDEEKKLCKSYAVARIEAQKRDFEKATSSNRPPVQTHVF